MSFKKITSEDREGKGVSGLPNTPNLTPTQLQEQFDSLANLAIEKFNEFIAALEAASAAKNIGSADGTVQNDLTALRQSMSTVYQRLGSLEATTTATQNSLDNHVNAYYRVDCVPDTLLKYENRIAGLEIKNGISDGESGFNSSSYISLLDEVDKNTENISRLQDDISEIAERVCIAENELLDHVYMFINKTVKSTDWENDTTYMDYPYKAVISIAGADEDYVATVVFDVEQATSGMFAPVVKTAKESVIIYANALPDSDIIIPTILIIRGCNM